MKKIILTLLVCAALALPCAAQTGTFVKISQLPSAATLTGTEIVVGNQGGATVTITTAQQKTYDLSGLPSVATSGNYSDLSGKPTLGTLSMLTPTGSMTPSYVLTVSGSGVVSWSPVSAGSMTIGSNAIGSVSYSSGVFNFIYATNAANGLVQLDGSDSIPLGLMANYIGHSGGVQGYSGGTLVIAASKTFTSSNTITLSGTDGSSLNIAGGGTLASGAFAAAYSLPTATTSILGGVKVDGVTLTITGTGVVSAVPVAWELKSANFTAVAGHKYQIDTTSGAITVTLPASASVMDSIDFADASLSWNTNNVTLGRNGLKINNGTTNYTASVQGNKLSVVYISSGYGWSVK